MWYFFRVSVLVLLSSWLPGFAAEMLAPGFHKDLTTSDGMGRFHIIVPKAAADGQALPVVILLPWLNGLLNPFPWEGWAERRGCVVIAINDNIVRQQGIPTDLHGMAPSIADHVGRVLKEVGERVSFHPILRLAVADGISGSLAVTFAVKQGPDLAAVMLTRLRSPLDRELGSLAKPLPFFLLSGADDEWGMRALDMTRQRLLAGGSLMVRAATIEAHKNTDWIPQSVCELAIDHLLDLAMTTNARLNPAQRSAYLEQILKRGMNGLTTGERASFDQGTWMLNNPELAKAKPQAKAITELTNRWLEVAIALTKQTEATDVVEAHEFLSITAKRPAAKFADKPHQKSVADELKRLRKLPTIKAEVVAADLFADILALLDEDFSTAKQRIALKQLEDLVAKHPATHAGKAATKLLEPLRRNLR